MIQTLSHEPSKSACLACGFKTSQPCQTATQAANCPALKSQRNQNKNNND